MKNRKRVNTAATELRSFGPQVVREWRVDLVERWLNWSSSKDSGIDFTRLVRDAMSAEWSMVATPQAGAAKALEWVRNCARSAIEALADNKEWSLPISELVAADPNLTFYAVKGLTGTAAHYEGNAKAIGLLAIQALVANPDARRFARCIEPGCATIFVKRKIGRHCPQHATSDARARRFLATLTPAQRRERRHRYYLAWLQKNRPSQYRHMIAADRRKKTSNVKELANS